MLRAASAYTELGRFEAGQLAARANVLEHERLHRMILKRIENQITPSSDGLLAGARLSQARAELNQMQAQAARARARLAEIIGQTVGDIEPQPARQRRPASLVEASRAAVAFSPVLRRLSAQQDSAEADIQVKRGQALPQVKLRHDRNLGGLQPANQTYLMLEYQSGAGLASLSAIRQSEARRQALEAERQSALRDLSDEVSASWADLLAFEAQALELRTQVATTVLVFESFTRQYAIGRKNWIEVLNAQRELTQARQALADAEWSGLRSALKLQLATGQLSADRPPATTLD
jgi:adhesin transport system outer membrane protein